LRRPYGLKLADILAVGPSSNVALMRHDPPIREKTSDIFDQVDMKIIDSFNKENGQCQGLSEAAHSERGMDCTVIPLGRQVECSRRRCDAISRRLQSGRPIDSTARSRWPAVHRCCCCQCALLTTIASNGPNRSGPKGRW